MHSTRLQLARDDKPIALSIDFALFMFEGILFEQLDNTEAERILYVNKVLVEKYSCN